MAAIGRLRAAIFQPRLMLVRHRKSLDVRKPPPAQLLRRILQEITAPIELKTVPPLAQTCYVPKQQTSPQINTLNRYEEFILNQTQEMLKCSRMVIVYQHLPMSSNERRNIKVELKKNDFQLLTVQNKIMKLAIADTRMANLSPLLISYNYFVISEHTNVAALLKCMQPMHKMVLLGGMIDKHLLTKEGILECSKIPSLDFIRGELVTLLGHGMSQTRCLLNHHQSQLSSNLTQFVKQNTDQEEK